MKRTMMAAVLGFFAMGLSACGSSSSNLTPLEACNEGASVGCQKLSDCLGPLGLGILGYTSAADCTTQMEAQKCTATAVACTAPQTYSASNAQACIDAVKQLSCDTIANTPAICNQVCQ